MSVGLFETPSILLIKQFQPLEQTVVTLTFRWPCMWSMTGSRPLAIQAYRDYWLIFEENVPKR